MAKSVHFDTLSKKITSAEDMPTPYSGDWCIPTIGVLGSVVTPPWWLKREYMRQSFGVYEEQTSIVNSLQQYHPTMCVHISKEDRTQVAYTPDRAAGEADRQLRISLGRLLHKLYPVLSDDKIASYVAEHQAELSNEIEFLTDKAITDVYIKGNAGACMSKEFASLNGHHPTEAYWAPNIAMAVLRDAKGAVNARAMVYTPSETDKRIIRSYGDKKLYNRLLRAGYSNGTWHGAKFNKVEYKAGRYLLPYLDGNGGAGGAMTSCVALIDNELVSINETTYNNLRSKFMTPCTTCHTNTNGYVNLANIDSTEFQVKCELSGVDINILLDAPVKYWNGEKVLLVAAAAVSGCKSVKMLTNQAVLVHPDTPTFNYRYTEYLDTEEIRRKVGFVKLSSKYYTEEECNVWYELYSSKLQVLTSDVAVLASDTILLVPTGGHNTVYKHKSELDFTWIKLHSREAGEVIYAESADDVLRTVSGRKVVENIHAVVQLFDGTWEFTRNAKQEHINRVYGYFSRKDTRSLAEKHRLLWAKHLDRVFADLDEDPVKNMLYTCRLTSGYVNSTWVDTQQMYAEHGYDYLWANAPFLREDYYMQEFHKRWVVFMAERDALDYSVQNVPGAVGYVMPPVDYGDFWEAKAAQGVIDKYLTESAISRAVSEKEIYGLDEALRSLRLASKLASYMSRENSRVSTLTNSVKAGALLEEAVKKLIQERIDAQSEEDKALLDTLLPATPTTTQTTTLVYPIGTTVTLTGTSTTSTTTWTPATIYTTTE